MREKGINEVLSIGDVRYLVVRPHRGMKDGYEVINAWNQDQCKEFGADKLEDAVEWAQAYSARDDTFDQVLVVREPDQELMEERWR